MTTGCAPGIFLPAPARAIAFGFGATNHSGFDFPAQVFAEIPRVTGASNAAATRFNASTNLLQLELFHDGRAHAGGCQATNSRVGRHPTMRISHRHFKSDLAHRHIFVASCPILPNGLLS